MSKLIDRIENKIHGAKTNAHDFAQIAKSVAEEKLMDVAYVDLVIQVRVLITRLCCRAHRSP